MFTKRIVVAILVGVVTTACREESPVTPDQGAVLAERLALTTEDYQIVGRIHNEALDFVYRALASEKDRKGRLTRGDLVRVLVQSCHQFMIQKRLPMSSCRPAEALASAGESGSMAVLQPRHHLMSQSDTVDTTLLESFLVQIENAAGTSLSQYQQDVISIQQAAAAVLIPEDLEVVYAVGSISNSSAEYWDAEVITWYDIVGGCDPQTDPDCPEPERITLGIQSLQQSGLDAFGSAGWRILGADVGAAIGSGIIGRIARAFSWQVVAGAAAGASAARGVMELLELVEEE